MPRLCSAISVGIISALSSLAIAQIPAASRTPVLVELFTSEGCSSCPPADALLEKLDRDQPIDGVDIIALGEHVDYWDNLGWHDRFSSHQYTERQGQYSARLGVDGVYTPQMIVDGTDQFVGNDAAHARQSIQHAAQRSKLPLELARPILEGRSISSSLSSTGLVQTSQAQGDIYAALVDDNDSTDVRNGENGGRRLHHVAVVRTLQRIGTLRDLGRSGIPFNLNVPPGANSAKMRLVAFVQQEDQGAIIGVVSTEVNP
jgi:hypothetical protein